MLVHSLKIGDQMLEARALGELDLSEFVVDRNQHAHQVGHNISVGQPERHLVTVHHLEVGVVAFSRVAGSRLLVVLRVVDLLLLCGVLFVRLAGLIFEGQGILEVGKYFQLIDFRHLF